MSDEYPPLWVPVSAYFLPRGMSRAQYAALGLDVALKEPKTLRPDPKVVRDAVLTAKKLGFAVVRIDSMSLDLQAGPGLLETHFGAAFVHGDEGPPQTEDRLVDAKNRSRILESAEPLAGSPLRDLLFIITAVTQPEPMMPRPPGQPNPRGVAGKFELWHVWPDELRQTLNGFESDGASPPKDRHRSFQGSGAEIQLVDSGIDRTHPWFITDLGIALNDARRLVAGAPNRSELYRLKEQFTLQASLAGDLIAYIKAIRPYTNRLRQGTASPFSLEATDGVLIRGTNVSGITIGRLDPDDADTDRCAARFYAYLTEEEGRAADVRVFQEFAVAIAGQDPRKAVGISRNINDLLDELMNYLNYVRQTFVPFVKWVDDVLAGTLLDLDGHGTEMAASMLSIAGSANVRSFAASYRGGTQPLHWYLKGADTTLHRGAFQEALQHASIAAGPELKIISNSWGDRLLPLNPTANDVPVCQAWINYWRWQVTSAVTRDIVVCFAAGNSANPPYGRVSVQALTGPAGAIIVGGAYKKPSGPAAFRMGDGDVYLSSAAHAYDYKKGGMFWENGRIPDVCGLVGPELGISNDPKKTYSPYVYLPSVNDRKWAYGGGGTSSACAQVAGVCALIRARYPGFSAGDIKRLITDNSQPVGQGESFNHTATDSSVVDPASSPAGRPIKATDFAPRLKLVSIRDIIKLAASRAASRHFTPAGARP